MLRLSRLSQVDNTRNALTSRADVFPKKNVLLFAAIHGFLCEVFPMFRCQHSWPSSGHQVPFPVG